jgi:hypothetical protein
MLHELSKLEKQQRKKAMKVNDITPTTSLIASAVT